MWRDHFPFAKAQITFFFEFKFDCNDVNNTNEIQQQKDTSDSLIFSHFMIVFIFCSVQRIIQIAGGENEVSNIMKYRIYP